MADLNQMNELIDPDGFQKGSFQYQGKSSSRKQRRAKERAGKKRSKPAKTLPYSFRPQ